MGRWARAWTGNEVVARGEAEGVVRGGEGVERSWDRRWRGVAWRYDCKTQFSATCFAPEFLLDQLRIVELAPSKVQISSQSKPRSAQEADGRQGDRAPIAALPCGPRVQSHGTGRGQHHD